MGRQDHVLVLELGAEFKSADYILVLHTHIKLTHTTHMHNACIHICMYVCVLKKQKTTEEKDMKTGDVIWLNTEALGNGKMDFPKFLETVGYKTQ